MRSTSVALSIGVGFGALLSAPTALAQDGLALNRFDPAPAGDRFFVVESPYVAGEYAPHVSVATDFASNPLAFSKKLGLSEETAIVSSQLHVHVQAGFALWDRFLISAHLPFAAAQSGDNPQVGDELFLSPDGAALGDLRLGLRGNIFGEIDAPFQLGASAYVWIPTGDTSDFDFVSDGSVRFMPKLLIGGDHDRVVWSANFGPDIRSSQTFAGITQGTMLRWHAGLGVVLGDERRAQLGPEFSLAMTPEDANRKNTNIELLLSGKYRFIDELEFGLAAGPGLTPAHGTPDARLAASIAYTPDTRRIPPDLDSDGVIDARDMCPIDPGPPDAEKPGCPPPPDTDGDGIADPQDACVDKPGPERDDERRNGCPSDSDGDLVIDSEDACPEQPAPASANPDKPGCPAPPPPDADNDGVPDASDTCPDVPAATADGCPVDADGDGVRDDEDACPTERGTVANKGCLANVRVGSEATIALTSPIRFADGTAELDASATAVLDDLASALNDHPEIASVEIGGHTDNKAPDYLGKKLTKERADAVKAELVKRGVADARVVTKGYGAANPVGDNKTPEGQGQNNRITVTVLKTTSAGAAQ